MIFNNETVEHRRGIISEMLQRGICDITFTKVNGETRKMSCTLSVPIIEKNYAKTSSDAKKKKKNPDNMSVWDINKNDWRSFKLLNVIEVIPSE